MIGPGHAQALAARRLPVFGVATEPLATSDPAPEGAAGSPLRVLLIDGGAHHLSLIHDELSRLGHLVVGVLDSARSACCRCCRW